MKDAYTLLKVNELKAKSGKYLKKLIKINLVLDITNIRFFSLFNNIIFWSLL
jgi:hypothetical protein